MINNLIKSSIAISLAATVVFATPAVRFNVVPGDVEDKYEELVLGGTLEKDTGFSVSDPHEKINDAYLKRYGNPKDPDYDKDWTTNLDNLGFFSISNDVALHEILKKAPQAAGFQPFNLHIYKSVSEDKTYIGHLDANAMLDITGVKDAGTRKAYVDMYTPLDKWVTKNFGGKVETSSYDTLPAKPMMTFEIPVDRSGDIVEWAESFQEELEAAFEEKKYIIAGFKNFKATYEEDLEMEFTEYDQFFVYGLCHFTYSYGVFNKGRPDAGAFAPCAMYFYIKPGSNTMVVGMPRLETWLNVMKIKNEAMRKSAFDLDVEIISIMKGLGAKEI